MVGTMKDKNSSNNKELSVRERMALDKEIRRVSSEIRKEHPSDWREILKSTDVYKKRHNISYSENQNTETKKTTKPLFISPTTSLFTITFALLHLSSTARILSPYYLQFRVYTIYSIKSNRKRRILYS